MTCRVPQGSILGPLFFRLCINDLCLVANSFKFLLFSDDANILSSSKDTERLIDSANFESSNLKIVTWC